MEENKAITKTMASKIAKSGLHYDHMKTAFERNGFDGLTSVLGETVNGAVRVTKQGKIIQNILSTFHNCELDKQDLRKNYCQQ